MKDSEIEEFAKQVIAAIKQELLPILVDLEGFPIPQGKVLYLYSILRRAGYWMRMEYEEKIPKRIYIEDLEVYKKKKKSDSYGD